MTFNKDLLTMEQLTFEDIEKILNTAKSFEEVARRPIKKVPVLRGKTVANVFYEPSTRTRLSFELAAKRLSADLVNIIDASNIVEYGETLTDIAKTIEAMTVDFIIVRHSQAGAPHLIAKKINSSVINAGDGHHENPTQSLVDLYTIREEKGFIENLRVALIGDIIHSRDIHSNIWGLKKMGAEVVLIGPKTLIPPAVERFGVDIYYDIEEGLQDVDVVMLTRVLMTEDNRYLLPSLREYSRFYCLTEERLKYAKPDVLVMHSGALNRGVEIAPEVADGSYSIIMEQISYAIAVRMAVLYLLSGKKSSSERMDVDEI
jgi:aspartate carbamoyltransferase catalytic subunit